MPITRRDLTLLAGGTAAGALLTPAPWRVFRDSAIWTQNWSLTPKLPRGEVRTSLTACTLCPQACAVRARSVAGVPFALAGAEGALCALGVGAHHLPYHPQRLRGCLHGGRPVEFAQAEKTVRDMLAARPKFAVLDCRPGRTASLAYRRVAATYIPAPQAWGSTAAALAEMTGGGSLGIDFSKVETVLSFATPVLENWVAPARLLAKRPRIIQVEARHSRTAGLADIWLAPRPGAEGVVALGIAAALQVPQFRQVLAAWPAERIERESGLSMLEMQAVARELKGAIAVGDGDPVAGPLPAEQTRVIAALNLALNLAAFVPRRETPGEGGVAPTALAAVPEYSLELLFIDEPAGSTPLAWDEVKSKLAPGATVVAFAAAPGGAAAHAEWVFPARVFPEALEDATAAHDHTAACWRVSAPLLPALEGTVDPVALLTGEAYEEALKKRAAAIQASRRGSVGGKPVAECEDLWKAVREGAGWTDDPSGQSPHPAAAPALTLTAVTQAAPVLVPAAVGHGAALLPPLMAKLYQESDLVRVNVFSMGPAVARAQGLAPGDRARAGSLTARVTLDPAMPAGVVEYCAPPAAPLPGPGSVKVVKA